MSALELAIVADDLTGAADSCASLAGIGGHRTAVFFEGGSRGRYGRCGIGGFGVVAFDTDSRSASPDEARRRVFEAGKKARPANIAYKKIDSTLRGNIAVEIAAMMEATGRECAIVAPAFPRAGRTTAGGTQLVGGVPVHETDFARDPRSPVRESHLPAMLSDFGDVRLLSVSDLEDTNAVRNAIEASRIVVVDAADDSHLHSLVGAVVDPSRVLWVGSAGLASAFPLVARNEGRVVSAPFLRGGSLVVVGSLSGVSRGQLRSLVRGGVVLASVRDASAVSGAGDVLRSGGCAAIHSPSEVGEYSPGEVSGMLSEAVASLEGCFGSLVMTGGDTAVAASRRLGATGIEVLGEVEPGVPFGRLIGGRSQYPVVTKAGGFGEPGSLLAAVRFLSAERSMKK